MSRVLGTREVIERLHKANAAMLGIVAEEQLQRLMVNRVTGRFDQGIAPDGSPWPGLLASTLKRKGYLNLPGNTKKPLVRSGTLRKSLGVIRGGNQGLLASSTGLGFRVGVRDPEASRYGRIHNYGLGQEKRQFIGLGSSDVRSVRDFFSRRLKSIAKA